MNGPEYDNYEPQCATAEDMWTGTKVITFYFSITREEYLYIATGSFRKTVVFYSPVICMAAAGYFGNQYADI